MSEFLDSSALVRYLTDDPPEQARRVSELLDASSALLVSPLVLAEVGYVLTRVYGRDRAQVVAALTDLLRRRNVQCYLVSTELALEALELCRPSGRVSFADALLWAEARSSGATRIWSFDRRFPGEGILVQEPP